MLLSYWPTIIDWYTLLLTAIIEFQIHKTSV